MKAAASRVKSTCTVHGVRDYNPITLTIGLNSENCSALQEVFVTFVLNKDSNVERKK